MNLEVLRAGGQGHVAELDRDELGDTDAGGYHRQQQGVVASAEPGGLVGRVDERVDLWLGEVGEVVAFVDRKSTRLNSSHPSISYAVFCLKKKKKKKKK